MESRTGPHCRSRTEGIARVEGETGGDFPAFAYQCRFARTRQRDVGNSIRRVQSGDRQDWAHHPGRLGCFFFATLVLLPFLARERKRRSIPYAPPTQTADGRPATLTIASGQAKYHRISDAWCRGVWSRVPDSWHGEKKLSTGSNGSLISLTVPIITAVLASIILNEKMTLVRWASLGIALGGVLILSDIDWRHLRLTSGTFLLGNILILVACTANSFYNVYCKELVSRFTPTGGIDLRVHGWPHSDSTPPLFGSNLYRSSPYVTTIEDLDCSTGGEQFLVSDWQWSYGRSC